MNEQAINEYVQSVGLTNIVAERVKKIHAFYTDVCPQTLDDLIISEYLKEDGERVLENLWFFSSDFVMEAKQFLREDNFDFAPFPVTTYLRIIKTEYDFVHATTLSRLNVHWRLGPVNGQIKASQQNCDYLRDIVKAYIVPRLEAALKGTVIVAPAADEDTE